MSAQAFDSNFSHGEISASRPVIPWASISSMFRSQPLGVMLPMGSFTSGLGSRGSRFDV